VVKRILRNEINEQSVYFCPVPRRSVVYENVATKDIHIFFQGQYHRFGTNDLT